MKNLTETLKQIYHKERLMFVVMILNILGAIALFVLGIIKLNPESAIVKIGYGDIGGYRNGSWADILAFPIFAVILGFFHELIALRIYEKRGAGMTKFFLVITSGLILGGFVVLARLTGGM